MNAVLIIIVLSLNGVQKETHVPMKDMDSCNKVAVTARLYPEVMVGHLQTGDTVAVACKPQA